MKWFEKHLNWTAVITPILFFILGFLIIYIFYFFSPTPAYYDYPPLDLALILTLVFSHFIMYWILRRKKQNLLYLLFFILPLIVFVIIYTDLHFGVFPISNVTVIMYEIFPLGGAILWASGWILIPLLKNKALATLGTGSQLEATNQGKSFLNHLQNKTLDRHPGLRYVFPSLLIAIIVVMGTIAGNSTNGRDCSYISYSNTIKSADSYVNFSFEYPRCFDLGSINQWRIDNEDGPSDWYEIYLPRYKFRWFFEYCDEWAVITVVKADKEDTAWGFNFSSDMSIVEKAKAQYLKWLLPSKTENEVNILENRQLDISGIQADYVVLSEQVKHSYNWSISRFVFFKHSGFVWVIEMYEDNGEYELYFNHLLETFRITD